MRAIVLEAETPLGAALLNIETPTRRTESDVLVQTLEVGVCETDALLLEGHEGDPPPGESRLVLGHEVLGRVAEVGRGVSIQPGTLVACRIRLPDPVPCTWCAVDRPDRCLNNMWTERGIRGAHGFMRDYWVAPESDLIVVPERLRCVGVLLEPLSVVVKLLSEVQHIEATRAIRGSNAVVLGAGPVGLLVATMLRLGGQTVSVIDALSKTSGRAEVISKLGVRYIPASLTEMVAKALGRADLVVEATGSPELAFRAMLECKADSIVGLLGRAMLETCGWTRRVVPSRSS